MTVYSLPDLNTVASLPAGCVVALGNFDGFHLGHRAIVSEAVALAANLGQKAAVWTFSNLAKTGAAEKTPQLTSMEDKLSLLRDSGADFVVFEEFDAVRSLSPADFANGYLLTELGCSGAVCGFNFRFGARAEGDSDFLAAALSKGGALLRVVDPVRVSIAGEDVLVSSTSIRKFVADGDMEKAEAMLGRPFFIGGTVVDGFRLGRTIGIPTVNQNFPAGHVIPKGGIYASKVTIDGVLYYGVTNIGRRPTVSNTDAVNSETHIFSYDGDLYGRNLQVYICKRLRDEQKFPSLEELVAAIRCDIVKAKEFFSLDT